MRRAKLIFLIIVCLFILQLVHSYQKILVAIGQYLVCEQAPQQADLIVIAANWDDTIIRARGGADLYKGGMANTIFIPRMRRMHGQGELMLQGIQIPENRDILIAVLHGLGVPLAAIETTVQEVKDTWDEAAEVRKFVDKGGYKSILLVTSKYHSRRAYLIFKDALKGKATVISVPTPYDLSDPRSWWTRRDDAQAVIMEYQKLLVYLWRKLFS